MHPSFCHHLQKVKNLTVPALFPSAYVRTSEFGEAHSSLVNSEVCLLPSAFTALISKEGTLLCKNSLKLPEQFLAKFRLLEKKQTSFYESWRSRSS